MSDRADPAAFKQRIDALKSQADLAAIVQRRVPKLRKAGREYTACCPFHDERTPSFTVAPEKGFYHCFGCGAHGDAIKFVQDFDGVDFGEAVKRITAECGMSDHDLAAPAASAATKRQVGQRNVGDEYVSSTLAGKLVWRECGDAHGTLVETYLRARGVDPAASGILSTIRYQPRCPVSLWRKGENWRDHRRHCPAMLLPICRVEGGAGTRELVQQGVEVVFLAGDGRSKMKFAPIQRRDGSSFRPKSRKIWGKLQGGGVPIVPAGWDEWRDLDWINQSGALVVAEGLESTLSLMARIDGARGGFATLSLDNMQGRAKLVRVGQGKHRRDCLPLHNLRADTTRAVFTVPDAGSVTIGVDADMKGLKGRWVQDRPRGRSEQRDLSGIERSRICAALAQSHWRAAGAGRVTITRPQSGKDFNDYDQRALKQRNDSAERNAA